jgi:hypothetical protein
LGFVVDSFVLTAGASNVRQRFVPTIHADALLCQFVFTVCTNNEH